MIKHTAFFMINIWIRISALSVLLCILVSAYASHGITSQFTMSNLNIYWTAVIYHLFHSIGLLFVALFNNSFKKQFYVHLICICFLVGIIFLPKMVQRWWACGRSRAFSDLLDGPRFCPDGISCAPGGSDRTRTLQLHAQLREFLATLGGSAAR